MLVVGCCWWLLLLLFLYSKKNLNKTISHLKSYIYSMEQLQEKPSLQVHGVKEGNEGEGSSWWSGKLSLLQGNMEVGIG